MDSSSDILVLQSRAENRDRPAHQNNVDITGLQPPVENQDHVLRAESNGHVIILQPLENQTKDAANTDSHADVSQYSDKQDEAIHAQSTRLALLFLLSNLFTMLLTAIPVIATFPDLYPTPNWYTGADILRILEPTIALPLQLLILLEAPLFPLSSQSRTAVVLFALAAAVYQQGAAFHSVLLGLLRYI